jgi:hypothetical protein
MVKQLGVELWSTNDAKIRAAASAVYKTWFAAVRNPRRPPHLSISLILSPSVIVNETLTPVNSNAIPGDRL